MKKIYFLLFASFCLMQAKAQNTYQALYGNTNTFFANGSTSFATVQTTGGNYVTVGHTGDYDAGDLYLLKTNNTGAIIWYKLYSVTDSDKKTTEITTLANTSDGGFIMGGKVYGVFGNDDLLVIKTDSEGNVQWHKVFGAGGNSMAKAIKQTSTGEYIVAGTADDLGNASAFHAGLYALKLSASGDSVWTKTYNYNSNSIATAADVQIASDGNFVIGGTIIKNIDSADADKLPVLLKVNAANGNIIWSKSFGSTQLNPFNEKLYDFATAQDGGFILTGEASVKYGYSDGFMMKVGAGGNTIQWAKRYATSDTSESEEFNSIVAANDGFATYGDAFSFKTSKQFCIALSTDNNGNVNWANHVGNGNSNYGYSITRTQDNGYLLGGYEIADFNFQSTTAYILKADAGGSTGCYSSPIEFTVTNENYSIGTGPLANTGGGNIGGEAITVSDAVIPVTMLCQNPAPDLQFTSFTGKKSGTKNTVSWRTKSELKSDKYYVQRSTNKTSISILGEIDASYKTLSNNPYSFTDDKPGSGNNYYRIKAVSKNGNINYSKIITINNSSAISIKVSNTSTPGIVLFQSDEEINDVATLSYSIYNSMGNKVYDGKLPVNGGKVFTTVNLSSLNNGIYFVHFNTNDYLPTQQVIINQ